MNFKRLADKAKRKIDERGGTERLKQDAERLRGIAKGPGTTKEKARKAGDALKEPAPGTQPTSSPGTQPTSSPGTQPTSSPGTQPQEPPPPPRP